MKDDFNINVMFDATFLDMRSIEQEMLKICSYYINKNEPLLDNDIRNLYPSIDRLQILDDILELENEYQEAKVNLVLLYLEAFEHVCDLLE